MHRISLVAIALSPWMLNAQLQKDLLDPYFEKNVEGVSYFSTMEEEDGEDRNLSYEQEEKSAEGSHTKKHTPLAYPEDAYCHSPNHVMRMGVRHSESKGVGYKEGYTTLEGFGIYNGNSYFMPFLDLRGHVFNNGQLAGNVGIGERSVLSPIDHLFGIYCYYDVRQEDHHLTVNQISPGLELLGKRMEYRINGYFPVGKDKSHHYGYKFDRFDGHHILLKSKQKAALTGGDAEVGSHLTQSTHYDLYAGAGPYYFSSSHASSWGGKVRLLGRYKEYVSLEATYSYDHLFGNVFQGSVGFNYPFGSKLKRKGKQCPQQKDLMLSRACFAPYRFEIPVVKKVTSFSKAINPATDSPWQVWFVNNTSSSLGTIESPFPTLLQAQAASQATDIIYVFPGDGTNQGMNVGIVLQSDQKLFGAGIPQSIETSVGKIRIPALSSGLPLITTPIGNVVTLANGNEVSGVHTQDLISGNSGVFGGNIEGAFIHDNLISSQVSDFGIALLNSTGTLVIERNTLINAPATPFVGVLISSPSDMDVTIANNQISGFMSTGISLSGGGSFLINSNDIGIISEGDFECIRIATLNQTSLKGTISNNQVSQASYGIGLNADLNGSIEVSVVNNIIAHDGSGGLNTAIFSGFSSGPVGTIQAFIENNTIRMVNGQAMDLELYGNHCVTVKNNFIDSVTQNGILIRSESGQNQAIVIGNTIENVNPTPGLFAANIQSLGTSNLCVRFLDNVAITSPGFGFVAVPTAVMNLESPQGNQGGISWTNVSLVPSGSCSCNP
jgi:hypothetical protein